MDLFILLMKMMASSWWPPIAENASEVKFLFGILNWLAQCMTFSFSEASLLAIKVHMYYNYSVGYKDIIDQDFQRLCQSFDLSFKSDDYSIGHYIEVLQNNCPS